MGKIILEGLEFFAHHGVYEEENKIGNKYNVDIIIESDLTAAMQEDNIRHTVNYGAVYAIIEQEMRISSKLLEYVGGRIIKRVFATFPQVEHVHINICKFNPPIGGIAKWAKVSLFKSRKEA